MSAHVSMLLYVFQAPKEKESKNEAIGMAGAAERMAVDTLLKMAGGGIYDHLGGGFHRYSVDELWHVPHFEKVRAAHLSHLQSKAPAQPETASAQVSACQTRIAWHAGEELGLGCLQKKKKQRDHTQGTAP